MPRPPAARSLIDMGGILGSFKRRLFYDVIDRVEGGYDKILICDSAAAAAVSSVTRMHELIDHGVTLVEDLFLARQPLISSPAIYLISTDERSVQRVIDDWQRKAMYREAHIFFLSVAPDKVIQKIATEPRLALHVKTLKDVMLDFMTNESLLFHLSMQSEMSILFSTAAHSARAQEMVLEQSAARLVSVLRALQSGVPYLHFQRNSAHAEYTARAVWRHIQHMSQRSGESGLAIFGGTQTAYNGNNYNSNMPGNIHARSNSPANSGSTTGTLVERPVLIVVDRSFDVTAPLMHENTYQCLLEDLMPLDANGSYEHCYTDRSGRSVTRTFVLDENDAYWCTYRHRPFPECLESFGRLLRELLAAHPTLTSGMSHSPLAMSANRQLRELGSATRGLAEFQEAQAKLSLHTGICAKLSQRYNAQGLLRVSALEQQILAASSSASASASSSSTRALFEAVREVVSDTGIPDHVRRRVLLLYMAVSRPTDLSESKRQRLLQDGHLVQDAALVTRLQQLMHGSGRGGGESGVAAGLPNPSTEATVNNGNHALNNNNVAAGARAMLRAFHVLEAAAAGTLARQDFPMVNEEDGWHAGSELNRVQLRTQTTATMAAGNDNTTGASAAVAAPARRTLRMGLTRVSPQTPQSQHNDPVKPGLSTAAMWDDYNTANKPMRNHVNQTEGGQGGGGGALVLNLRHEGTIPLRSTQKVILFVLGGVTFAEARSAYEVSARVGKECIVGGTSIVRPESFVEQLQRMN